MCLDSLRYDAGSNDPMAVFLTVGLIQVSLGGITGPGGAVLLFVQQMVLGGLVGLAVGRLAVEVVNRIDLAAAGLYPVLTAGFGLLAYGAAATLGGSGFLSVYVAGIVLGSYTLVFKRGILLFHDGAAWLAQIGMFVLLGMLSFPSRLAEMAIPGLQIAAVLILIARPVATLVSLLPHRFSLREAGFISVAGLKGAVPIVLATYPLLMLMDLERGEAIFDLVFFVVLVSALVQGVALPPVAKLLGLHSPAPPKSAVSLEITSLKHLNGDIVEYTVLPGSRLAGRTIRDLALPDAALIAMIVRNEHVVAPRGSTRIETGDHLFAVLSPGVRPLVDHALEQGGHAPPPGMPEFPLAGSTTVEQLELTYGVPVDELDPMATLGDVIARRLGDRLEVGRAVRFGPLKLRALEVADGTVSLVGLQITLEPDAEPDPER